MRLLSLHRRDAVPLADLAEVHGAETRTSVVRAGLALALAGTMAALLLVARDAGAGRAAVFPEGTDSGVVALDMSASIAGPIYARVSTTLQGIVDANEAIGLVMFSDTAYELLPPNSPPGALGRFMHFFVPIRYYGSTPVFAKSPWDTFSGGTRVSTGLTAARKALQRAGVKRGSILVISDLDNANGDEQALLAEAVRLQRAGITVRIVPLFADAKNLELFSTLFGPNVFVDPRVFTHAATRREEAIAGEAPWALLALGAVLVLLLAWNERWNGRLTVGAPA